MKILLPFWDLNNFDRYVPQMSTISKMINKFHIVYTDGEVKEDWREHFIFHRLPLLLQERFNSLTTKWFLSRWKVKKAVERIDTDVVYSLSGLCEQLFSRDFSSWREVPYVLRLRGDFEIENRQVIKNRLKRVFVNQLQLRSIKSADLVIPISNKLTRKAIKEWNCKRVTTPVPLGVDITFFKPMDIKRENEDTLTVLYAGRISPEKGMSRLLRIAEHLPNIRFVVAGRLQMDVSFPENVEYHGWVPFDEMPRIYNRSDLVILPSLTEGFPCTILEAYACGKPVLVAKEAFPEEMETFGAVCDIEKFEKCLKTWNIDEAREMGYNARKYVIRNFTWKKFGKSIVKNLEDITARVGNTSVSFSSIP